MSKRVVTSGLRAGGVDLVEQLGGDGPYRDEAAGSGVFGDHERAVGLDLGDRKAGAFEAGNSLEEGIVAAGGVGATFENMARCHRRREPVPIVFPPAEMPGSGPENEGGVGHAGADHQVGTELQGPGDSPATEVGVGAEQGASEIGERQAAVEVAELFSLSL